MSINRIRKVEGADEIIIDDGIIIDNRDANTSRTGTWDVSGAANPYGTDSVWSRNGSTFTWKFTPTVTGTYDLSIWWTQWPSRSTNIPVDIQYAGGTERVYINQQANGGQWNFLGNYNFNAGTTYSVKITAQPGPSSTCADAVKFNLTTEPPPVIIVDNRSANTSKTGWWDVSGAANPYGTDSVWSRNGSTFTWKFTPAVTGTYDLSMWWTQWASRSANIPVDIQDDGGTTQVYINQQTNGGGWNSLGTYRFVAGYTYLVKITAQPGSTSTCADAVRFSLTAAHERPNAYITDVSPNPAIGGQTVFFDGFGTDKDSTVTAYQWTSNLSGLLSTARSFSTATLPVGTHTISFRVRNSAGFWSPTATQTLVVSYNAGDVIVDNRSTDTSKTGIWYVSGATNSYGPDSLWSRDGSTFTWKFTATSTTEKHYVSMWWTEWPSRSTNIPVDIQDAGGTQRVYINQQANGGQ